MPASIALVALTGCVSQSSVAAPPQSSADMPGAAAVPPARRPEPGEYLPVDQQAEPLVQVEPMYPDDAKRAGIEGTILVQALVVEDGGVAECRAVPSIPALEEAAVSCVRQWRFKPAMKDGKPVAVWVTVPVRFMLH